MLRRIVADGARFDRFFKARPAIIAFPEVGSRPAGNRSLSPAFRAGLERYTESCPGMGMMFVVVSVVNSRAETKGVCWRQPFPPITARARVSALTKALVALILLARMEDFITPDCCARGKCQARCTEQKKLSHTHSLDSVSRGCFLVF